MSDIRVAIAWDASTLAALEERSSVASLGHLFGPHAYPSEDVLARWTLVLQDPDVTILGAWENEVLLGFAAVDPVALRHFGVAPERFGTGLADELHRHVVELWRTAGTMRAELWVLAENTRARRFYERHGWMADGSWQASQWPPYPVEIGYVLDLSTR